MNETSYRKKLYIIVKYLQSSFIPLGFENNITQVLAVICDALPKLFSEVFHHYVGHLWENGGSFLTNRVLKCFEGLRPIFINLSLEVSPQEKIVGGQIR